MMCRLDQTCAGPSVLQARTQGTQAHIARGLEKQASLPSGPVSTAPPAMPQTPQEEASGRQLSGLEVPLPEGCASPRHCPPVRAYSAQQQAAGRARLPQGPGPTTSS